MAKTHNVVLASAAATAVLAGIGWSATAGAADLSGGASAPWGGIYIGLIGGYAGGNADVSAKLRQDYADELSHVISEDGNGNLSGGMIGGLIGYDYALGNGLVVGAVGDLSWLGVDGDVNVDPAFFGLTGSDYSLNTEVNWLGTIRGKIGYEFGNALIYGTGGIAFGGIGNDLHLAGDGNISSSNSTDVGWTVGAGISYMATDRLMLGLEYLYVDFGKNNYDFGKAGSADVNVDMSIVRGTIGYKF